MMDEFMKLLAKKAKEQKGPMHGPKMDAKAAIAKELSDSLGSDIMDGVKDMKKVTVASDSEEGLKKGLHKAEDVLESKMDEESGDESAEGESDMSEEDMKKHEESESEDSDSLEEDIVKLEKELEDKKKALKLKR